MSLAKRLQAYNITVDVQVAAHSPFAYCRIAIPRHLCDPPGARPRPERDEGEQRITHIQHDGDMWVFSVWDLVPGPGQHDFICRFGDIEDAVAAVLAYEMGGPTLLGPWCIPLHRHPELRLEQVRWALANAVAVSHESFAGIAERRHERIFGNLMFGRDRWEWAIQSQFLAIPHISDRSRTLRLRRDAQECYIVTAPAPPRA